MITNDEVDQMIQNEIDELLAAFSKIKINLVDQGSMNREEVESIIKEVLMKTKKSKDKNWDLKDDSEIIAVRQVSVEPCLLENSLEETINYANNKRKINIWEFELIDEGELIEHEDHIVYWSSYNKNIGGFVKDLNPFRVDARRNDHKGSKRGSKGEVKQKADNNNIAIEKLVYAKEKGLSSNQGDKISRCISDIKVNVDSVKVVKKFYIKHQLSSDVILGMPWVAKQAMFIILEDPKLNRNVLDKDCVNIRCVKNELLEKDDAVDKKKNRIINKLKEMKSNQAKGVNSKNIPVKSGSKDNMFRFDDNGVKLQIVKRMKDLEKGGGRCRWDIACCGKQQSTRCNMKEINFYKRLYLDQIAGYSSDNSIVLVNHDNHSPISKLLWQNSNATQTAICQYLS
ncbi:7440_t:CDS:2, partial [Gigaspora margarita]